MAYRDRDDDRRDDRRDDRGRRDDRRDDRGGRFRYRETSEDSVRDRAESKGGNYDSIIKPNFTIFRAREGKNRIRVLPSTFDDPYYAYQAFAHRYVGVDKGSYLCLDKMMGKPCAVCDAALLTRKDGEEQEYKKMRWKELAISWILDRNKDEEKPQLWIIGARTDGDVCKVRTDDDTGKVLPVDNPDGGYDLLFTRDRMDENTRYSGWRFARDPSPISSSQKVQDGILDYIEKNPIPSTLLYYPNEYLDKVINGRVERDKDNEDSRATESRGRSSRSSEERSREDDDRTSRSRSRRDEDDPPPRDRMARDEDDRGGRGERRRVDDDELPRNMRGGGDDDTPRRRLNRGGNGNGHDEGRDTRASNDSRGRYRDDDEDDRTDRGRGGRSGGGRLSEGRRSEEDEGRSGRARSRYQDDDDPIPF